MWHNDWLWIKGSVRQHALIKKATSLPGKAFAPAVPLFSNPGLHLLLQLIPGVEVTLQSQQLLQLPHPPPQQGCKDDLKSQFVQQLMQISTTDTYPKNMIRLVCNWRAARACMHSLRSVDQRWMWVV